MSIHRVLVSGLGWIGAVTVWAAASNALAQGCCGGGGHDHGSGHVHDEHSDPGCHDPNGGPPAHKYRTPHGGLFLGSGPQRLEVVFLPHEARVYLFGKSMEPLSARELHTQISLPNQGDGSPTISMQYVLPPDPKDQDYLAAAIELSQLRDETPIRFRFDGLPGNPPSHAEFTPFFHQSDIRPYVARVSFVQADREGLALQQTCPVTGMRLGDMGEPIKVLVGDRPLYLCCAGCIEKIQRAEEAKRGVAPPAVSGLGDQ